MEILRIKTYSFNTIFLSICKITTDFLIVHRALEIFQKINSNFTSTSKVTHTQNLYLFNY